MTECRHGLDQDGCDICTPAAPVARGAGGTRGTWDGKTFALVFAPSLPVDSFLHLNRQGDHWKLRWYKSPSEPADVIDQSGPASTKLNLDLSKVEFQHEIAYPHSTSPGGVTVKDSRYWFVEIAKVNDAHGIT
jgi:hypothetical protein